MISIWITQVKTCWSLACGPTEAPYTAKESNQRHRRCRIEDENSIGNKQRNKGYGIGKVLSTLTTSTATTFSSWTESFVSNSIVRSSGSSNSSSNINNGNEEHHEGHPVMVRRQLERHEGRVQQYSRKSSDSANGLISRRNGLSGEVATGMQKIKNRKNELLHPISPYDEIPTIRHLFDKLSPYQGLSSLCRDEQEEFRQERQDLRTLHKQERKEEIAKKPGRPRSRHKSDRTPAPVTRNRNDAHDVPVVVEMPTTPNYSEDSELSLDECLREYDEDERDQRTLTPHPSFEVSDIDDQPTARDVHHLFHASIKVEQELVWPSDEDNLSPQEKMIVAKKGGKSKSKTRHDHRVRLV